VPVVTAVAVVAQPVMTQPGRSLPCVTHASQKNNR